jgi:chromosome segregation ATPase
VEEKIANFRAVIQSKTIRIEEIRERITVLQQKISSIGSQCSSLKITYEKIEIEVNGLKKIIEIAEQKYIAFEEQVSSISI